MNIKEVKALTRYIDAVAELMWAERTGVPLKEQRGRIEERNAAAEALAEVTAP